MQPTIITGLNGAMYHNFPQPMYGAWNQYILGNDPYHYMIGGIKYSVGPNPPGTGTLPAAFPYLGPNVSFGLRHRF